MICDLCKNEINTKKEKYVHIEDWDKEEIKKEMWMHLACFNKAMNKDLTNLQKQAQEMLNKAGTIFNKISPKIDEYTIT